VSFVDLTGRTTVITGAAGGIGRATAAELANAGSNVALVDLADAGDIARSIALTYGVEARAYCLDIREATAVADTFEEAAQDFGSIDHLVNAHGVQYLSDLPSFSEDKWKFINDINLFGTFLSVKSAWPYMAKAGRGRIVNLASVHGIVASPLKSAYIASKHGVVGLTRAAAVEGAAAGITANAICPGAVLTEMVSSQGPAYVKQFGGGISEEEALNRAFLDTMPTRRFIDPSEIGQLCTFLCTDAARSITGSIIPIDGGWSAH
jgi:3-hydroxybutyrate dehydrogenase